MISLVGQMSRQGHVMQIFEGRCFFFHTIGAFSIESTEHHQVCGVCHCAFIQVVLLHLQPVALSWFVAALQTNTDWLQCSNSMLLSFHAKSMQCTLMSFSTKPSSPSLMTRVIISARSPAL